MKEESIMQIYNQHWLQARHIEQERMWFGNIFTAIIAGVFAILKGDISKGESIPLTIFFIIFSLFGIIINIRFWTCYKSHVMSAYGIIDNLFDESEKEIKKYIEPQYTEHCIRKVKISRLFPLFYNICLFGFLVLLGIQFGIQYNICCIIVIIVSFILSSLYIWKEKFYKEIIKKNV